MTAPIPDFEKGGGLVPAIIQDAESLRVLMLGYMNREAFETTKASGRVTFFSRSKNRLWTKGESSGHHLKLVDIRLDCDADAVLVLALPAGPTCHTGAESCFQAHGQTEPPSLAQLADLARIIRERKGAPSPDSYTASLFRQGLARMAQKVGEEGVECALAAVTKPDALPEEAADLLYHLLVLLEASGRSITDVLAVLSARRK